MLSRFKIFFITLFCINISLLFSEENEIIVSYGLKAGINLATLNGEQAFLIVNDNRLDATSKISAVGGLQLDFLISEKFAIQPELLLSMKGVNFDANEYIHTWSLWYLELPVLFKSVFEMDNNINGSFYVGPAIAYKLKSTWSEKYLDSYLNENKKLYGINDIDFSAIVGASFDMSAFNSRIGLDLRYTYGLIGIQKHISAQNGTISISLYYVLGYSEL
ncbi:PorT family protein [Bacteroidetes/Chlorobi group bacterium ChocPot_Mid]|jgi:hypothetical protein|nr:MAG: PorT family protein [Bacteroidetes/Chlorobi group bacterium ChocPot_Mid]